MKRLHGAHLPGGLSGGRGIRGRGLKGECAFSVKNTDEHGLTRTFTD
jgi:hypothetical protein